MSDSHTDSATQQAMTNIFFSFETVDDARRFLGAIFDRGVKPDQVSVITRDEIRWNASASMESKSLNHPEDLKHEAETSITVTTPNDAAAGATSGAVVGLGLGLLGGIAAITLPGIGLILGGGALATALAGAAAASGAGALVGGIFGYMVDLGVPAPVQKEFEDDFEKNFIIVELALEEDDDAFESLWTLADKYDAKRVASGRSSRPPRIGFSGATL